MNDLRKSFDITEKPRPGTRVWRSLTREMDSGKVIALVDTNAINDLADGKIDASRLSEFFPFITTVQYDELLQTPDESRRRILLNFLKTANLRLIHTGVFISGYSKFKFSKIGMGAYFHLTLQRLQASQSSAEAKRKHPSNIRDAILAETAIEEGMVLISNDTALRLSVNELGGTAIDLRMAK